MDYWITLLLIMLILHTLGNDYNSYMDITVLLWILFRIFSLSDIPVHFNVPFLLCNGS